ncbi:hypothetical protein BWI17_21460 [Betaproteobacteria bacterium GR16-43]|nr:hypothetical protein BWI17_21460 [Betaproteobacteria bacterium GR16-43]
MTPYLVGVILALSVGLSMSFIGFNRDRAFYPTVMIVIAFYYGLFSVMGGSTQMLLYESVGIVAFCTMAVLGFKLNLWWVVAALAAHGVYDFFHDHLFVNPGVPSFWPTFCLAYDVVAAAYLAWLLTQRRGASARP